MSHSHPPKPPAEPFLRDSKRALLEAAQAAIAERKGKQESGPNAPISAPRSAFRGTRRASLP